MTFWIYVSTRQSRVFDSVEMRRLRTLLTRSDVAPRVLSIRVGGNDLASALGIRRPSDGTIYESALGPLMAQLVATFKPEEHPTNMPALSG